MTERGVFSVARDIWDHPVLDEAEPFTKREAWMWLLSAAAWRQTKVGHAGRVVTIERGQFCYAIRFLERKWRWKPGRVERFLKTLIEHDMIRDTERDTIKVYSICNYNDYQFGHDENETQNATPTQDKPRRQRDTERDKERNTKQDKQEEKISRPVHPRTKRVLNGHAPDFEQFYATYPKHEARADAERAYANALARADPSVILAGAQRYASSRKGEDPKFTKLPATWLNKDCWLDEAPLAEEFSPDPELQRLARLEAEHSEKKR